MYAIWYSYADTPQVGSVVVHGSVLDAQVVWDALHLAGRLMTSQRPKV